jgi:large subunit ribosomal protein L41
VIDWKKVRTYVVPEALAEFKLTPFITRRMEPTRNAFTKTITVREKEITVPRALSGEDFLKEWLEENQEEQESLEER